jgi:hypothetical protein
MSFPIFPSLFHIPTFYLNYMKGFQTLTLLFLEINPFFFLLGCIRLYTEFNLMYFFGLETNRQDTKPEKNRGFSKTR